MALARRTWRWRGVASEVRRNRGETSARAGVTVGGGRMSRPVPVKRVVGGRLDAEVVGGGRGADGGADRGVGCGAVGCAGARRVRDTPARQRLRHPHTRPADAGVGRERELRLRHGRHGQHGQGRGNREQDQCSRPVHVLRLLLRRDGFLRRAQPQRRRARPEGDRRLLRRRGHGGGQRRLRAQADRPGQGLRTCRRDGLPVRRGWLRAVEGRARHRGAANRQRIRPVPPPVEPVRQRRATGRDHRLGRQALRRHRGIPVVQGARQRPARGRRLLQRGPLPALRPVPGTRAAGRGVRRPNGADQPRPVQLRRRCRRHVGARRRRRLRRLGRRGQRPAVPGHGRARLRGQGEGHDDPELVPADRWHLRQRPEVPQHDLRHGQHPQLRRPAVRAGGEVPRRHVAPVPGPGPQPEHVDAGRVGIGAVADRCHGELRAQADPGLRRDLHGAQGALRRPRVADSPGLHRQSSRPDVEQLPERGSVAGLG